jgi:hypothetical protein
MKMLFKTTLLIALFATVISCKKNDTVTEENYNTTTDSTITTVDTVDTSVDTVNTGVDGATGVSPAGTVEKSTTTIKTDSTKTIKKGK